MVNKRNSNNMWQWKAIALSFIICHLSFSPAGAQHTKFIQAVDEYVPAPGQFVNIMPPYNEGDTPESMALKCTDSIGGGNSRPDLPKGQAHAVTLGAYGGYITFHFDHPVANIEGQRDFAIWGNAFTNNAEPAIVMVAIDENKNGLPDDTFYELKGSEYDNPQTLHNYTITYTYSSMSDTPWTDNQGETGAVGRNDYHKQEYFPLWLADRGSLTFSGALLPKNASFRNGMFLLPAYDYGYADNQPNLIDYEFPNTDGCGLDISWAIDDNGQPVSLDHIDFVRVYNAMNQMCGWIGETSTEITGAEDLHLDESLRWDIATSITSIPSREDVGRNYSQGSSQLIGLTGILSRTRGNRGGLARQSKGIYIHKGKKHFIK